MSPLSRNTLQQRRQRGAKLGWAWRDTNSRLFHRSDLVFRATLTARHDRAGMAHPTARRGGTPIDATDHRTLASALPLILDDLCRFFLRATADLADHGE